MDWTELAFLVGPWILSFLIGLAIKSPVYQNAKKVGKLFFDAIQDDKIDQAEMQSIYDALKKKPEVAE